MEIVENVNRIENKYLPTYFTKLDKVRNILIEAGRKDIPFRFKFGRIEKDNE